MSTCDPATAAGIARFGLALFALLAEESTPVVLVSPLSISAALGLAAAGATPAGAAERELLSTLGISNHTAVAELGAAMLSGDEASRGVTLRIANSVWAKQGVLPAYQELVERTHGARAERLGETYEELNAWVASKTDGRIPKLMKEPTVNPLVVAVLVNAVYFLGSWSAAFDPKDTFDHPFVAPEGPVPARFMRRVGQIPVAREVRQLGGASVVRLDYGKANDADFCALLVLPAEAGPASLDRAVSGLQAAPLSGLLAQLAEEKVKVQLPRFKAVWGVADLVAPLRKLGLREAFDGDGQFLQLSEAPDVHIEKVFHQATLEVSEEGTVATAATAVVMMKRSLPRPPLEMTFDRPFLMLIVHAPTGVPLFVGRFNKPEFTK